MPSNAIQEAHGGWDGQSVFVTLADPEAHRGGAWLTAHDIGTILRAIPMGLLLGTTIEADDIVDLLRISTRLMERKESK